MTFSKHSLQFYSDFHQYQNWQGAEAFNVVNRSVKSVHCELFLMLLSNSRNLRWNSHYFVWKWPNNISNMIWFKAFFTAILYEIYFVLISSPAQKYQIYALVLLLMLDSRNPWWNYRKTHTMPKIFVFHQQDRKMILYSDVVQLLRYTKPLISNTLIHPDIIKTYWL